MKAEAGRLWAVIDADQRASRRGPDRVAEALAVLADLPGLRLPFDRTAGDEVQALAGASAAVVGAVERLTRLDVEGTRSVDHGWRIGIGLGRVEPLADVRDTREARGAAYLAAREAVERAGQAPARLAVTGEPGVDVASVESALVVFRTLLARRTAKGWEAVDAMTAEPTQSAGAKQSEVAVRLGLSESAVSQRLDRALWREVRHAESLARLHLGRLLEGDA